MSIILLWYFGISISQAQEYCTPKFTELNKETVLEIVYVFGYKDARPAKYVGDRYEKNQFVRHITQACHGPSQLCGFQRNDKDAFVFFKEVNEKKVFLKVINSSVTENDDDNRNHPMQDWLSFRARNELLWALNRADIVFYNGHSRAGGGPDFSPPLLKKDKHVDYDKYLSKRHGFRVIIDTLKKAKTPTKLLGLFSCKATKHFADELAATKKGTILLTAPHLIYYRDALNDSVNALEKVLAGDCKGLSQVFPR